MARAAPVFAGKPAPTVNVQRLRPTLSCGRASPVMASVWCQYLRGVCIAGKPACMNHPPDCSPSCGSGLARDGIGVVSVNSRCLYRIIQRPISAAQPSFSRCFNSCLLLRVMAVVRGAPSGALGSLSPGLPIRVQLPPLSATKDVRVSSRTSALESTHQPR